jgi:UDP-N-acetylmuramoyl-tripeptide--D-alanyl-D-alanine ligase
LAADRPGDIQYLVDIVKPKIGVITAVGEIPVHVEFYASPQAVAREKSKLIENLPTDGLAVLNYDDQTVIDMKEKTGAKALTFGFSNRADIWISDISYFAADDGKDVGGLSFKINNGDIFVPARINNLIGAHQLCSAMAAAAVGLRLGMNLVDISGALENVEPPERRMKLLRGIKNSAIIDDSYNASPLSVRAALDALRDFAKARSSFSGIRGRKIAVLGDMRELGKYEIEAHRAIGNLVGERANTLITVGAAAKFIADSAANQTKQGSIFSFNTADEAKTKVQEIIREGDVVLIKGSRAMQMEKIVEEIKEVL